jgi:hypothetical protein
MDLDYSVQPSLWQRLRPALQNWRLLLFIGIVCVPCVLAGYTFFSDITTKGIHQHGDYASVDLKAMGQFPFNDQDGRLTDVPSDYRQLDGKRVELTGMMWDLRSAGPQTSRFQLVYNIAKCCFGGPPKVQERVFVHVHGGEGVQFYDQQVDIVGTLHVRLKRNDQGTVESVYDMDLESLKPV